MMLGPDPDPAAVPGVASDIVAVVVTGVAAAGSVDTGPELPTGYRLILCAFSVSGPLEETVDVPVVTDPGDGCLENL